MFDPVDPKQSLPKLEHGILQYWQEEDVFKRSVKQRTSGEEFSFYDGPPFATGLPHYGHLLAGTIKDVIPRYQTMRGKCVQRRFGWDCHGLPVENLVEQENEIKDKLEIEKMGIAKFCELCCTSVQRYTKEWRQIVERMGRWVDMDWDYRTMDPEYMESIWWVVNQLNEKGLLYEGHRPMHICPRCVTPLSNFEVSLGYKDVTDQSVTVKFKLKDALPLIKPKKRGLSKFPVYVLAWTTTPWTLPGNLLLAVGQSIRYGVYEHNDALFVVAKNLATTFFPEQTPVMEYRGGTEGLVGLRYEPLFPYFKNQYPDAFRIVPGDFVTTDEGTGIVHIAPGFGEDDYNKGKSEGLELLQHVTMDGKFPDAVTDFAGQDVKPIDDPTKTDRKVIEWLEKHDLVFSQETYKHSYPHCWRCDSPLLNYATASWFVNVAKLKEKLLANNAKTEWIPAHMRDGRFGKWLEGARDWAISRNRYWGTPLPIWRCAETGDIEIVESRDELMRRAQIRFTKLTALRHGESEGNLIPVYQGKTPGSDLTKRGKEQAKHVGRLLAGHVGESGLGNRESKNQHISTNQFPNPDSQIPVDIIYCSPLARTRQTAQAVADATGAEVIVDERLREVEFGEYEGKNVDFDDLSLVKARRAHKLKENAPESIYHFPGMETWKSVQDRVDDFLHDILPKHRSQHIVIVTHADPLQNIKHFFTKEDPVKISHQPYPRYTEPHTYYWDHDRGAQMDLHKHAVDDIEWPSPSGEPKVEVTFVRHGETDWNKNHKIQGRTDTVLNAQGKEQALTTAKQLKKGAAFDVVISSNLKRAAETAEIISEELGVPFEAQWEELRERSFGQWEGRTRAEVAPETKSQIAIQELEIPQGETLGEFLNRIESALGKLRNTYPGKRVLVVTHGGVLKAISVLTGAQSLTQARETFVQNGDQFTCTLTPVFHRIPEVLDCWFESGSMPYAQAHYPFAGSWFTVHGKNKNHEPSTTRFPGGFHCRRRGPDPRVVLHADGACNSAI